MEGLGINQAMETGNGINMNRVRVRNACWWVDEGWRRRDKGLLLVSLPINRQARREMEEVSSKSSRTSSHSANVIRQQERRGLEGRGKQLPHVRHRSQALHLFPDHSRNIRYDRKVGKRLQQGIQSIYIVNEVERDGVV